MPTKHIAETLAQHEHAKRRRVCCRPGAGPHCASISERCALAADVIVDGDARMNIGASAESRGVALDDPLTQRVDGRRNLDGVARVLHRLAEYR